MFRQTSLLFSAFISMQISCKSQDIRNLMGSKPLAKSGEDNALFKNEPLVRRFNASEKRSGSLTFDPKEGMIKSQITLVDIVEPESKLVRIPSPGLHRDILQQGNPQAERKEFFEQNETGVIDIQLIIDNSLSMQQEQQRIKTSLKDLLNYISHANWQIHVSSTDPGDSAAKNCSRGLIRKGDTNASEAFELALDAGVMGSSSERGVLMAVEGLKCFENGWLRKDSTLAILFVSDEDNCSNGNDPECTGQDYKSPKYLLDYLSLNLGRKLGADARAYGLFWVPGTTCQEGQNQGFIYQEIVRATNGQSGSICEGNYGPVLQSISKDINSILKYEFLLKTEPLDGSVKVLLTQKESSLTTEVKDFLVNGRFLRFLTPPPPNSKIEIQYQAAKILPVTSRFKASKIPDLTSLKVMVEGKPVEPSEYSFDTSTNELVLKAIPNLDAEVRLEYWAEAPRISQFDLGVPIVPRGTRISINDEVYTNFQAAANGIISFGAPLSPGAVVIITFQKSLGLQTAYKLDVLGEDLRFLGASGEGDLAIKGEVNSMERVFHLLDQGLKADQIVTLKLQTPKFGKTALSFPEKILPETFKLQTDTGQCSHTANLESAEVVCNPAGDIPMTIQWSYQTQLQSQFTINDVANPDTGAWQVFINSQESINYTRSGKTIILTQSLNLEDQIEIRYIEGI